MNEKIQHILTLVEQSNKFSDEEKNSIVKTLREADKEISIASFKIERLEKVKYTTTVLLEQTIEELEAKRKAAEQQKRELEIEAALERVRTRTMAMQKSDELQETSLELFQQLKELGEPAEQLSIGIMNETENFVEISATLDGKKFQETFRHSCDEPFVMNKIISAWKAQQKSLIIEQSTGELEAYNKYRNELTSSVKFPTKLQPGERRFLYVAFFSKGMVGLSTSHPRPKESLELLERFASVFDLTYTRFSDLKQAEAQTRESQIQLALERVRAKTMAMQKHDDLLGVLDLLVEQLTKLGVQIHLANFSDGLSNGDLNLWVHTVIEGARTSNYVHFPRIEHSFFRRIDESLERYKKDGFDLTKEVFSKEEKDSWFRHVYTHTVYKEIATDEDKELVYSLPGYAWSAILLKDTWVSIARFNTEPFLEEEDVLLRRFAHAFGLAYTRFLDLKKAEEQAREVQIQLALERVRARTMAMQHSDELSETAYILFQQFKKLGEDPIQITIGIFNEEQNIIEFKITGGDGSGSKIDQTFNADIDEPTLINKFFRGWKENKKSTVISLEGKELSKWIAYRNKISGKYAHETEVRSTDRRYAAAGFFSKGLLSISKTQNPSEETLQILERFASVFDLTYTRFLDLKNAEAQAKEARIESALEKVRSRSLAMHKSDELSAIAKAMFEQLRNLGLELEDGLIIMLFKEGSHDQLQWPVLEGLESDTMFLVPYFDDPVMNEVYNAREKGIKFIERHFNKSFKDDFLKKIFSITDYKMIPAEFQNKNFAGECYHYSFAMEKYTGILMHSYNRNSYPQEYNDILVRFARVFEQAYVRFLDLQKAEAQAKEAQIEAALERVRSRTLAMQKSNELAETAAVLFRQLILMGISPNRLYINVVKDENANAEFWITDEDGSKVSSAFEANLNANPTFLKMFNGWKEQRRSLTIDMKGEELQNYFAFLNSIHVPFKGGLSQERRVQTIAYFSHGFIGIASPEPQPEETLRLLERFASVFNLTFTRFNDLKIAEAHAVQAEQDLIQLKAEKKKTEEALTNLKATQSQLVQAEKMASLGELTAGIAHEIQNPLNFVNNFAEINTELVDELKEELSKGSLDQANLIADDLKDNNQKIAFHGKRADSIVKGMLQHSRANSGKKEPTDINSLADEFLRLSYHGLRAKDKSFNATMETNFDYNIDKVQIIPQDLGRVLLNLFNNAFYSVSEKKKRLNGLYEPKVFVSTQKLNDKIEITVKDNGNGIPQKIIDKIYQPFFTTKPTGEGTGLGLSLSYDIITKGHNGELKVETKEGEFAQFKIILPTTV